MSISRALSILRVVEGTEGDDSDSTVQVDENALQEVFGKEEYKDVPALVISINGRPRTGKSFLLNQILKKLHFPEDPDWINKSMPNGFEWKGGYDRITTGIQVWSDPFLVQVEGQIVAVFLMDCQGLFDSKTTTSQAIQIFTYSALISSLFIYNERPHCEEVLQTLGSFFTVAQYSGESNALDCNQGKRVLFQNLLLLLRDWVGDQENAGYEPYKCGYYNETAKPDGQETNFMQTTFFPVQENSQESITKSADKCRKTILDSFESAAMYLMANPGLPEHFPNPNEHDSKKWHSKFRDCVVDFVTRIVDPSELSRCIKTIGGDMQVTCGNLLTMAKNSATALETVQQLEIPPSIVDTMQLLYLEGKQKKCLEHYRREMNSILKYNPTGMAEDRLETLKNGIMEQSLLIMGNREDTFGFTETFDSIYSQLELLLQEEGKIYTDLNHAKFVRQESHEELEAQKRQQVSQADNRLVEAQTDLQIEKGKLQEIHKNRENYTTNVTTVDRYTHHLFGIKAVPIWTTPLAPRVEARFDENRFNLAVASQERTITEKEQRVNTARKELEEAQNDLDTFLSAKKAE